MGEGLRLCPTHHHRLTNLHTKEEDMYKHDKKCRFVQWMYFIIQIIIILNANTIKLLP